MVLKIAYWIVTALAALAFAGSAAGNLTKAPQVVEALTGLGYPAYFPTILGLFKAAGVLAVLIPQVPRRLKEAAYTGFFLLVTGAVLSHLLAGDPVSKALPIVVLGLLMVGSFVLFQKKLALEDA